MARLFLLYGLMKCFQLILVLLLWVGCQPNTTTDKEMDLPQMFRLVESGQSGLDFVNEVEDQEDFNVLTYRNYYNGGGVAIGDINNDNLPDIYLTANMSANKLYLNQGGLTFEDITIKSGVAGEMEWSTGVTMADVNGDGWLDIYVCNSGDVAGDKKDNELYINNQDLTFTESAEVYGLNDKGFSTHASFFDYDRDGDLDMYLVNNSFKDPSRIDFRNIRHERNEEGGDKLFRNDDNSFVDVSEEAGIYGSKIGFGLGVSVSDINGDRWPDLYISNDFWERDYLYINQGNGTYAEELTERIPMTSTASMGADIADIDNNGTYEIFSTDMLPATNERLKRTTIFNDYNLEDLKYRRDYHYQYTQNCLQLNDGTGHFHEIANLLGVAATDWSWGALMFDFDNDGLKDIFVSNGVYHDITDLDFSDFIEDKEEVAKIVQEKGRFDFKDFLEYLPSNKLSNFAFVNKGELQFVESASQIGLGLPAFSNGSAYGDLDNDGDLDLVINNVNSPTFLYENKAEQSGHHFITLSFESSQTNSLGVGVAVEVLIDNERIYYQNYPSRGFQSSTEPKLTIGIGKHDKVDQIKIFWPSGKCSTIADVAIDQETTIVESENSDDCEILGRNEHEHATLLTEVSSDKNNQAFHSENLFNDFDIENLMPHMVSTEGPEVLVGDLNGDDREDYIILGASQDEDKVFIQSDRGEFALMEQPDLTKDQRLESTSGHLIDLEKDGDLDLLIGSGGNDPAFGYGEHILRTYRNDGTGRFTRDLSNGLKAIGNFSVIESFELTSQSRAIFLGGRMVPGNYGLDPRNYLFREVGPGQWTEITNRTTGQTGMVTDAAAFDIDGDSDDDLIIVGEWMPIKIFENMDGQLQLSQEVPNSDGLWQSVMVMDANQDGLQDLILGNWGTNSKLQASPDKPLRMYVSDFDKNSKSECIIEWYAPKDGKASLFAVKNDLTEQIPQLKKAILKNYDYAQAELSDLFTREQINSSLQKKVTNLNSSILLNRGKFDFEMMPLPLEAQFAPVFALAKLDVNQDGLEDIILGGNMYGLKPEIGRMNSSNGLVLLNEREGFEATNRSESGLFVKGQIRDIKPLESSDHGEGVLIGINDGPVRFFVVTEN